MCLASFVKSIFIRGIVSEEGAHGELCIWFDILWHEYQLIIDLYIPWATWASVAGKLETSKEDIKRSMSKCHTSRFACNAAGGYGWHLFTSCHRIAITTLCGLNPQLWWIHKKGTLFQKTAFRKKMSFFVKDPKKRYVGDSRYIYIFYESQPKAWAEYRYKWSEAKRS